MALDIQDYRNSLEACLARAEYCYPDIAAVWRQIAHSYRLLIELEEWQNSHGARIAQFVR
jgi:hypothetical protein